MRTLADMTPEERAGCRGMWCDFPDPDERTNLAIYVGDSPRHQGFCELIHEGQLGTLTIPENLTPRPDLPRAWAPDGQPPAGQWEDGHVVVSYDDPDPGILKNAVSIEGLSEGGMSYYDAPPNGIEVKLDKFGEGEGKARRWVGEWEEA